jgi:hypothetical protein
VTLAAKSWLRICVHYLPLFRHVCFSKLWRPYSSCYDGEVYCDLRRCVTKKHPRLPSQSLTIRARSLPIYGNGDTNIVKPFTTSSFPTLCTADHAKWCLGEWVRSICFFFLFQPSGVLFSWSFLASSRLDCWGSLVVRLVELLTDDTICMCGFFLGGLSWRLLLFFYFFLCSSSLYHHSCLSHLSILKTFSFSFFFSAGAIRGGAGAGSEVMLCTMR